MSRETGDPREYEYSTEPSDTDQIVAMALAVGGVVGFVAGFIIATVLTMVVYV